MDSGGRGLLYDVYWNGKGISEGEVGLEWGGGEGKSVILCCI